MQRALGKPQGTVAGQVLMSTCTMLQNKELVVETLRRAKLKCTLVTRRSTPQRSRDSASSMWMNLERWCLRSSSSLTVVGSNACPAVVSWTSGKPSTHEASAVLCSLVIIKNKLLFFLKKDLDRRQLSQEGLGYKAGRSLSAPFVSSLNLICELRTAHILFIWAPGSQHGAWHRAGTRQCSWLFHYFPKWKNVSLW